MLRAPCQPFLCIKFIPVIYARSDTNSLSLRLLSTIGIRNVNNWTKLEGGKKREKKIRLVGRWNLGYFFSTRERHASGEWNNGCGWNERGRRVVELFTQKYTPLMRKVSPVPDERRKQRQNVDRSNSVQSKAKNKRLRFPWKNLISIYNNARCFSLLSEDSKIRLFNLFH